MPGPGNAAVIDAAWTRLLAVGEAAGYLEQGAAPNILLALPGFDRATAAKYVRRLLRVVDVAVFLPEPMLDVTELFYVDGAAGYACLTELRRRLPTLPPTTWGDPDVGLEYWIGREPLLTSVPGAGDDWANERDARMTARLAPVLRAGNGAMRLSLREGADRAFLLPPAPSDWDVVFAAPRLLPWYLPRVFAHLAHRLATATRDPLLGVARLSAACAMLSALLATYERDRRLFRPPPLARWAVDRFGPTVLAQGNAPKEATLRLLVAAWPHVPWGAVRRRLPYASMGKEPPLIPYAHRGMLLSAERHWVGVLPHAGTPLGLGCTERALRGALPAELPYVDVDEDGYGEPSPLPPEAGRAGGAHRSGDAASAWGAAVDTAAARGAAPITPGGGSQRSDPAGGSVVGPSDDGGPASPGSAAPLPADPGRRAFASADECGVAWAAPATGPGAGNPTTRGASGGGGHPDPRRSGRPGDWDHGPRGGGDPPGGGYREGHGGGRRDGWDRPAGGDGGGGGWGQGSQGDGASPPGEVGYPLSRGEHDGRGPRQAGRRRDGDGEPADAGRRGWAPGHTSPADHRDAGGRPDVDGARYGEAGPASGHGRGRGGDDRRPGNGRAGVAAHDRHAAADHRDGGYGVVDRGRGGHPADGDSSRASALASAGVDVSTRDVWPSGRTSPTPEWPRSAPAGADRDAPEGDATRTLAPSAGHRRWRTPEPEARRVAPRTGARVGGALRGVGAQDAAVSAFYQTGGAYVAQWGAPLPGDICGALWAEWGYDPVVNWAGVTDAMVGWALLEYSQAARQVGSGLAASPTWHAARVNQATRAQLRKGGVPVDNPAYARPWLAGRKPTIGYPRAREAPAPSVHRPRRRPLATRAPPRARAGVSPKGAAPRAPRPPRQPPAARASPHWRTAHRGARRQQGRRLTGATPTVATACDPSAASIMGRPVRSPATRAPPHRCTAHRGACRRQGRRPTGAPPTAAHAGDRGAAPPAHRPPRQPQAARAPPHRRTAHRGARWR